MPYYDFECQVCGHRFEALASISDRDKPLDCPVEEVVRRCGALASATRIRDGITKPPSIGTERKRGDSRMIFSEKQVSSELGSRWRDAGTTGRPGGVGKRSHFHR